MLITTAQVGAMWTTAGLAWAGLAAVSVPIVIHLLTRLRRRPQVWGAMRFLMEAYRRHRTRLQLEQWLLLATRCLIVALLGAALAGPMLSGCAEGTLGALAGSRRVVHLVIDDSLTTQADDEQDMRFERLRRTALTMLDHLRVTDRVAVWRAARPSEAVLAEATLDHEQARRLIQTMQPRYSRADLPGALSQVRQSLLDGDSETRDEAMVIVLSDFSHASLTLERPAPAELSALGDRARLWLAQPMSGRGNVQIASLQPRRHLIVADGMPDATVTAQVKLRRFGDEAADRRTRIELTAVNSEGHRGETIQREFRWAGGQDEAILHVDVPLADLSPRMSDSETGGHALALHGRIIHGGEDDMDVLAADNQAWAIAHLRQSLTVGLIDTTARGLYDEAIAPRQWLTVGLSPLENGNSGIGRVEQVQVTPETIDAERLRALDAVMVLRPDLLSDQAWAALVDFTHRGGLTWFFAPASEEAFGGLWGGKLAEVFNLNWRTGIETLQVPAEGAWTLLSEAERTTIPDALRLLAADWAALTQPIRITRRVTLDTDRDKDDRDSVWLVLNDEARSPWLASAVVGDGRVLLLASAVDPQWSNLPTKPLFVPLLHETLRGVLGESPQIRRLSRGLAGERPLLSRVWEGVPHVTLIQGVTPQPASMRVLLQRDERGVMPTSPLDEPGLWAGSFGSEVEGGHLLAMNVDADAGDTRALQAAAVEAWFQSIAPVQWLDENEPASVLMAETSRLALGWPLLAVVLGLILLETAMARWFSHATTNGKIGPQMLDPNL